MACGVPVCWSKYPTDQQIWCSAPIHWLKYTGPKYTTDSMVTFQNIRPVKKQFFSVTIWRKKKSREMAVDYNSLLVHGISIFPRKHF